MSMLRASCCCGSCYGREVTQQFSYAFTGSQCPLGMEYNFPATYTMKMTAPVSLCHDVCVKEHACYGNSPAPDCRLCGTPNSCQNGGCYGWGYFYPCHDATPYLTGSSCSTLNAFKWDAYPKYKELETYTQYNPYPSVPPYINNCADEPQNCISTSTPLYLPATGNVAWATGTQTITNLGGFDFEATRGAWGKFYDGLDYGSTSVPNNMPRDDCKWIIGASSTQLGLQGADVAPAFCGYKFSQQIDHVASGGQSIKVSNTYMTLGYNTKAGGLGGSCNNPGSAGTPSFCAEPCEDPCFCLFLRVRVESNLRRSTAAGVGTCLQGGSGYFMAWGNTTGPFGGALTYPGKVSTIAYYRKYWDGKKTVKEFMEQPMDLYQIQGGASDQAWDPIDQRWIYTWIDSNTTRGTVRKFDFASAYINQGTCSNVMGCQAYCVPHPDGCKQFSVVNTYFTPLGCCLVGDDACDCENYVRAFCDIAPQAPWYCTQHSETTCTSCPTPPEVYNTGYTDHSCIACTNSRVEVFTNKTAPGGAVLTQADLDTMPCDWTDVPLTITPVFNPLPPVVTSVNTMTLCGAWSTPPYGVMTGNTPLLIKGCHLLYATEVTIGGVQCPIVRWQNNSEVYAQSPPSTTTGAKPVLVRTSAGWSAYCGTNCNFTYYSTTAPASLCTSSNFSGPCAGDNIITVNGWGLGNTTSVTVGGINAPFAIVSSSSITVRIPPIQPPNIAGVRTILVFSAAGSSNGISYTYNC